MYTTLGCTDLDHLSMRQVISTFREKKKPAGPGVSEITRRVG